MTAPTSSQIPKCRLCGKNHFARETCRFESVRDASHAMDKYKTIAMMESRDTPREGRRVLKGSTGRGGPAKPKRTPATARANPPAAMKVEEGAPPRPEPTIREPGAAARPARKVKGRNKK